MTSEWRLARLGADMDTYVAMLRAINVGNHNKIKMPVLTALFVALGGADVTTYIQSGNVVFNSPVDIADAIEARIEAELGLDVRVIVRTGAEMAEVAGHRPFADRDMARVYVTFLAAPPDPARLERLEINGAEPDEFVVQGREVHLHCPGGFGRTKLNNGLWERRLGVVATTRNWNTVTKLAQMAEAAASRR